VIGYQKTKDSGVDWIGNIPEHWDIRRLKRSTKLVTEKASKQDNPIALENIEGWTGCLIKTETKFEGDGIAFNVGDILFGKLRPYLAKAYLADRAGEAVGDLLVLRPEKDTNGKFTQYQILNREFISIVNSSTFGSKMPRTSWDFMGNMLVTAPPIDEQEKIVNFLDRETAKIDELIQRQEKLIQFLNEKKQVAITQFSTRGFSACALKESDDNFLGLIPKEWKVSRLKYFTSKVSSGKTPSGGATVYSESGIKFLRSQNIYDDGLHLDDVVYISSEIDEELSSSRVEPNDVLLNITGASLGRTCIVPTEFEGANVNQHVCIIRVSNKLRLNPKYLSILLKADFSKKYFDYIQNGSGREGLNFEQIRNLFIPVPPILEQEDIVKNLEVKTAKLDGLISKAQKSMTLLKEHRASLISAAVTGKIDVREVA